MSNIGQVPEELVVGRSDPVYMAHGYLTKVPVPAIVAFIEAYTEPGDVVLDPFAGSGMTGVAAAASGRQGRLFDISVLGQHIGRNYVNLVDADLLRKHASYAVGTVKDRLGDLYAVPCSACGGVAQLAKTVWSTIIGCGSCGTPVNFYRALEAASWNKPATACPNCTGNISTKSPRVGEEPVIDYVLCDCAKRQQEQPAAGRPEIVLDALSIPHVEITPDRQMYKASALGRNGLTTVASFYSPRNLAVLAVLREQIAQVTDEALRSKLLFAFTASLTRASKRYQWSKQRPLNAANANYYVAPVFYEWNVFDLFLRKVEAVIRSDEWVRARVSAAQSDRLPADVDVTYELGSAEAVPLADGSVDYVFTDPPFGSNLFYADMALFQEAWLGEFTDSTLEAVVDRGARKQRSVSRYEQLLTAALSECRRILKSGGRISMVFGNSTGAMWSLVQRAIHNAGLLVDPDGLVVLNKGQRSVKGLASGFEHVATLDLVVTMTAKPQQDLAENTLKPVSPGVVVEAVQQLLHQSTDTTPSHLYLELLRTGFREGWDLSTLDLSVVTRTLSDEGWAIEPKRGSVVRPTKDVSPTIADASAS
ncbi:MAG: hypothetical protein QOF60_3094 [Actinomycetota bacterium]|jgi:16S rRNA G966 N2-methylase RsmD|nr:hypothetical protein [Actinomycetota bacterium]